MGTMIKAAPISSATFFCVSVIKAFRLGRLILGVQRNCSNEVDSHIARAPVRVLATLRFEMVGPPRILGDTVYNMRRITLGAWGSRISRRGSDVMSFLNLWKQQLGEVPDAVWDRVDLE